MRKGRSRFNSERSFCTTRMMPTDELGMPVTINELNLPPSRLNPNNIHNKSVHHGIWPHNEYVDSLIGRTLVNLERHHTLMMNDQHNMGRTALHSLYLPPRRPSLTQAYNAIREAYEMGEGLEVKRTGHGYERIPILSRDMDAIEREYIKVK